MKKVYIYKAYTRFWHWSQMILIFLLLFTGFEVHGSYEFFGFAQAVRYHEFIATAFIFLSIFTIFWHFTTGEWRQYIPTFHNIKLQADYYLIGIFKNAPHPIRKTALSKLNPLQRLVYFGLKVLIIPMLVISGLLYMFYRYEYKGVIESLNIGGLGTVAIVHTMGAFLIIAFIIAHVYLITTGHTVLSNLSAMITGHEDLEDDDDHYTASELKSAEQISQSEDEIIQ